MKVQVVYRGDKCIAIVPIRLSNGKTMLIRRACDMRSVRRALERQPQMAGFFGNIGKAVRSVARSSAIRSAVSAASKAARNPIVRQFIPPQVSTALTAASTASRLINAARGRGRRAQQARGVLKASLVAARRERAMPPSRVRAIRAQQMRTPGGRAFRYLVTINRAA